MPRGRFGRTSNETTWALGQVQSQEWAAVAAVAVAVAGTAVAAEKAATVEEEEEAVTVAEEERLKIQSISKDQVAVMVS